MDIKDTECPKRVTALVCHELTHFDIDMAALDEIKLIKERNIREIGCIYIIF